MRNAIFLALLAALLGPGLIGCGGGGGVDEGIDDGTQETLLPDLVLMRGPGRPGEYYVETQRGLAFYIQNRGPGPSPGVLLSVYYQMPGEESWFETPGPTNWIGPGEVIEVTVPRPPITPADMEVTVDSDERVEELDESNNTIYTTY